jgi:hypothetical protein
MDLPCVRAEDVATVSLACIRFSVLLLSGPDFRHEIDEAGHLCKIIGTFGSHSDAPADRQIVYGGVSINGFPSFGRGFAFIAGNLAGGNWKKLAMSMKRQRGSLSTILMYSLPLSVTGLLREIHTA